MQDKERLYQVGVADGILAWISFSLSLAIPTSISISISHTHTNTRENIHPCTSKRAQTHAPSNTCKQIEIFNPARCSWWRISRGRRRVRRHCWSCPSSARPFRTSLPSSGTLLGQRRLYCKKSSAYIRSCPRRSSPRAHQTGDMDMDFVGILWYTALSRPFSVISQKTPNPQGV